jgi:hypothetical protein
MRKDKIGGGIVPSIKDIWSYRIAVSSALTAAGVACGLFLLTASKGAEALSTTDGIAAFHGSKVAELFRKGMDAAYRGNTGKAVSLFNQGASLDRECGACLWGLAWALSTDLERAVPGERLAEARSALRRARAVKEQAAPRVRRLIEALEVLYDAETEPDADRRRAAYVESMRKLTYRYPGDPDVLAAFAFSLISAEEADHWSADGWPRPAIREALAAANRAIRADRGHAGARRVYEHVSADLVASQSRS